MRGRHIGTGQPLNMPHSSRPTCHRLPDWRSALDEGAPTPLLQPHRQDAFHPPERPPWPAAAGTCRGAAPPPSPCTGADGAAGGMVARLKQRQAERRRLGNESNSNSTSTAYHHLQKQAPAQPHTRQPPQPPWPPSSAPVPLAYRCRRCAGCQLQQAVVVLGSQHPLHLCCICSHS